MANIYSNLKTIQPGSDITDLMAEGREVVILATGQNCPACETMAQRLKWYADDAAYKIEWYQINIQHPDNRDIQTRFEIYSIPTTLYIRDGVIVTTHIGTVADRTIRRTIGRVYGF